MCRAASIWPRETGAFQPGGRSSDRNRCNPCLAHRRELRPDMEVRPRSATPQRPLNGAWRRRTSPAVHVHVVPEAAWRSIARLRRCAPSTGLDAEPHASPVHRAPFHSRRTSSSGDPTAAQRPSEPDSRPAPAARRVHFKLWAGRAIEIAATPARLTAVSYAPKLKCAPFSAGPSRQSQHLRAFAEATFLDLRP